MSQDAEKRNPDPPDPRLSGVIRVLVADDHPIVREGVITLVERQTDMTVVAEAGNGEEAVALFLAHRPDPTFS